MKRFDFQFLSRSETHLRGLISLEGKNVWSFDLEKNSDGLMRVDSMQTPITIQEHQVVFARLKAIADFHFGRNYLWV